MDYILHNTRTGEAHLLNPGRATIGATRHATVTTQPDGPTLAALVVRYPTGWAVHGLSDDAGVTFNGSPLHVPGRATPRPDDELAVGIDRFRFLAAGGSADTDLPASDPPACAVYLRYPDGMEECRAVDHDLLIGRRSVCHVRLPDRQLSRLSALLAAHGGTWYVHRLTRCPVVRNGEPVDDFTPVDHGDELLIGPLALRIELVAPALPPTIEDGTTTIVGEGTEDTLPPGGLADLGTLHASGVRLDLWLRGHKPAAAAPAGIGGWLGAQREKLQRFWYDTPEATTARSLRAAGRASEAFTVLDRAIRQRPDSPTLLRELYRLYESAGLTDLCYRPLRQIEKLTAAHGETDVWVLETLARVCEQLGPPTPEMFDRAVAYWNKLEAVTGVSRARERTAVLAGRALHDGGFAAASNQPADA
jgi:hypothetical protein